MAEGSTAETSGVPSVVPLGVLPKSFSLRGPDATAVMQPAILGLAAMAYSVAAFLADGKTVTLSVTSRVPCVFWNWGLFTDGGFSVINEVETPMQWASCLSPTVLLLLFGFLVDVHPAGMSERTSSALCAC